MDMTMTTTTMMVVMAARIACRRNGEREKLTDDKAE